MTDDPRLFALGPQGRSGLEAILFLADEPVPTPVLAEALEVDEPVIADALGALVEEYADRGIEIRSSAGGWRMYSSSAARGAVERWALSGRTGRLTQAALETLAVIAYKQPISRADIGDIRGVNADASVRSLVARGLVEESGRDSGPGQAFLYATTPIFLERLGLDSLADLPPLTDYLPEGPAPDEPELGGINEIRRRLAAAGGRGDAAGDQDGGLPPPRPRPRAVDDMGDLSDRLESAARSAMDRLRTAVTDDTVPSTDAAPVTTEDPEDG
ncbi:MAG: SMC-Scp complex subunit ScpB [Nitriliruptoraceae bacterium]